MFVKNCVGAKTSDIFSPFSQGTKAGPLIMKKQQQLNLSVWSKKSQVLSVNETKLSDPVSLGNI